MSKTRPVSILQVTLILVGFFLAGAALAMVTWHTLSDFLAGLPVAGGQYLLALALAGVFVGLAWLLARYLLSIFPLDP
ncbi:MAG: hypothetical protein WEA09_07580 [Gemmatimonadota bacterium]